MRPQTKNQRYILEKKIFYASIFFGGGGGLVVNNTDIGLINRQLSLFIMTMN